MSKIKQAFENGKAFIAFITCGDPDLATTAAAVRAAVENGADIIELGIPFSDPTAEGPVIQGANLRALQGGVTTDKVFDLVRDLRRDVTIPLVFMTYANVVFSYGAEKFIGTCREVGIDGLILPDVPYEEKEELDIFCKEQHLHLIPLVSPATPLERAATIVSRASGFIYCVAVCGVTGARSSLPPELKEWVEKLKSITELPLAVGFGVSSGEMAHQISDFADAVVVGSAALKPFFDSVPFEVCLRKSSDLICELRKGVNQKKTV